VIHDWKFPREVAGWLTEAEGRRLAELAKDKTVLEIGSFHGLSTICMAQAAAKVVCIDPCDGRATPRVGDTEDAFLANVTRFGVAGKVRLYVGTTEEIAPTLEDKSFDLVFIDGDHSRAAVKRDIAEALRLLAPGGLLAFHDYNSRQDPDVTVAVNQLLTAGAELVSETDSLAVVKPGPLRSCGKPVVLLGMPRRGELNGFGSSQGYFLWPTNGACEVVRTHTVSTVLDHGFNRLWATALNLVKEGVTHFAMIHDDVAPGQGWVDVLLAEMALTGADVISTVVPIKTEHGLTSTAIETDDPWLPRRLTMADAYELPETFSDGDVGGELLLNTGLWICDIRKLFWTDPTPLKFQTDNRIVKNRDGEWEAQARSEDWEFSRAARKRGAKLFATRKVALYHAGETQFPNDRVWGAWKTDEVHVERMAKIAEVV
jgi:SAM-dependent methyltransferase